MTDAELDAIVENWRTTAEMDCECCNQAVATTERLVAEVRRLRELIERIAWCTDEAARSDLRRWAQAALAEGGTQS